MATTAYKVKGMTCEHCVNAVSSELTKIEGVSDVSVELESGEVKVTSATALDEATVRAAVDEAGFELVS